MTDISRADERDGARVHDLRVADDAEAFLVEPTQGGRGPAILFLHWFDTQAPDGNRTQFVEEAVGLAREHGAVSLLPQGRFPWAGDPTDAVADEARIRDEVARHRAAVDLLAARRDETQYHLSPSLVPVAAAIHRPSTSEWTAAEGDKHRQPLRLTEWFR